MKYSELETHLQTARKGGGQFAPLYIVSGDDDYLKARAVDLFKSLIDPEYADFNLFVLSATSGLQAAADALYTFPMFDDLKVVIVTDIGEKLTDVDRSVVDAYMASPSEISVFVAICSQEAAKGFTKSKKVQTVDCSRLSDEELIAQINAIAAKDPSRTIEIGAAKELISRTLGNMSRIVCELVKLKAYCAENITRADVCEMVSADLDIKIYELSNAVSEKNADGALKMLDTFLKDGVRPMTVLSLLYGHYRKLLHVELHKSDPDTAVAGLLGVKPTAVYHLKRVSGNYSQVRLKRCVDYLHALQYDVLSGRRLETGALHEAILELLQI